jgi:hypothetical protein
MLTVRGESRKLGDVIVTVGRDLCIRPDGSDPRGPTEMTTGGWLPEMVWFVWESVKGREKEPVGTYTTRETANEAAHERMCWRVQTCVVGVSEAEQEGVQQSADMLKAVQADMAGTYWAEVATDQNEGEARPVSAWKVWVSSGKLLGPRN